MTRVDFYVLPEAAGNRLPFACRLTEKAFRRGHRVYLHLDNPAQAQRVDDLLWTFRQSGFLPHERLEADGDCQAPILIGYRPEPPAHCDLLINLSRSVPPFCARFQRVAELVADGPAERALAPVP
jgi:DNA polymerase-3 subunit chi